ncbi:MAG: hypothetical protein JWL97_802 [Gemmatimonadales bacterium]|jgi:hypothetical protein|nr:hypothetical protein [Gemmatimonadales bacterium]
MKTNTMHWLGALGCFLFAVKIGAEERTPVTAPSLNFKGAEPGMTSQQIRQILGVPKGEVAKCEKPVKLKGYSPWPVCRMDVRLEGDTDWWSELVMWVDPRGSVVRHLIVERFPPESIPDSVIWASVEADWGPPDSVRRFDSGKEMDRW